MTLFWELRVGGERRCKVLSVSERERSTPGWGSSWFCCQQFLVLTHLALVKFIDPPIAGSKDLGQGSRLAGILPRTALLPAPSV